jgi:hypothetical protein
VAGLAAGLGAAAGLGGGAAGLLGAEEVSFFCAVTKDGMALRSKHSSKPRTKLFLRWLQFIFTLLGRSHFIAIAKNFAGMNRHKAPGPAEKSIGPLELRDWFFPISGRMGETSYIS